MFIHTNLEEITQLPMDHNGVSSIDEKYILSGAWCHQMMLKRQENGHITISLVANINPISVGYMKNKKIVVNERSI